MHEFLLLLPFILTLFFSLASVPLLVWMERRIAALIQHRPGPNRCNIGGIRLGGIIQSIADVMKLLFKQELLPSHITNRFYYLVAPSIAFVASFLTFMVIPYADTFSYKGYDYVMQALPVDLGILWFIAFAGLSIYGIILGGWSSHNKFAIIGSMRASAQVIGYEIAMGLSLVSILITYGTIHLNDMVVYQSQTLFGFLPAWGILVQPLAAVIFIVTAFAETNRAPFDAAEGESEIVAGYHTEYGAMKFGLYFVAEYVAMAAAGALIVTLFFGGYQLPWLGTDTLFTHFNVVIWALMAVAALNSYFFIRWIKKNNMDNPVTVKESRFYIRVILFLTVAFELLLLFGAFFGVEGTGRQVGIMLLQFGIFAVKLFMFHFFFIWVRWTLPRFRYDQTQKLGWNILLPLAMLNIAVTAIIVVGV
jgi:NADH-quinone oxidoreductase subunit H